MNSRSDYVAKVHKKLVLTIRNHKETEFNALPCWLPRTFFYLFYFENVYKKLKVYLNASISKENSLIKILLKDAL